ncbi:hypothetical protein BpHYR1_031658 [Brachionus plicatilis]|uniref:Uncharacterized protein n=1 Tax=Brachionus plicatilis TaxID=10195 RepID=A0A3M7QFF0_BRAPC|nr:hypothetical protein BpHYR1_031658 [Brachionus plicatilis]
MSIIIRGKKFCPFRIAYLVELLKKKKSGLGLNLRLVTFKQLWFTVNRYADQIFRSEYKFLVKDKTLLKYSKNLAKKMCFVLPVRKIKFNFVEKNTKIQCGIPQKYSAFRVLGTTREDDKNRTQNYFYIKNKLIVDEPLYTS